MQQNEPLGVAILGFGFIGKVHAYGHLNMPLFYDPPPVRTKLVGVATSSEKSAQKAKATLAFDVATTDQLALIERDDVHVVHICTPNDLHLPALLAAVERNKHIYCDKPLTATLDEAEQVAARLHDYRGTGQMTLQYRFLPATIRARQLIDEGSIGGPAAGGGREHRVDDEGHPPSQRPQTLGDPAQLLRAAEQPGLHGMKRAVGDGDVEGLLENSWLHGMHREHVPAVLHRQSRDQHQGVPAPRLHHAQVGGHTSTSTRIHCADREDSEHD